MVPGEGQKGQLGHPQADQHVEGSGGGGCGGALEGRRLLSRSSDRQAHSGKQSEGSHGQVHQDQAAQVGRAGGQGGQDQSMGCGVLQALGPSGG